MTKIRKREPACPTVRHWVQVGSKLYELDDSNYRRLCHRVANGRDFDIDHYGLCRGFVETLATLRGLATVPTDDP